MNTYEIACKDTEGQDQLIHIVAPDAGEAMITFREEYSIEEWTVDYLCEVIGSTVIEKLT
jgi:hypothetical protein